MRHVRQLLCHCCLAARRPLRRRQLRCAPCDGGPARLAGPHAAQCLLLAQRRSHGESDGPMETLLGCCSAKRRVCGGCCCVVLVRAGGAKQQDSQRQEQAATLGRAYMPTSSCACCTEDTNHVPDGTTSTCPRPTLFSVQPPVPGPRHVLPACMHASQPPWRHLRASRHVCVRACVPAARRHAPPHAAWSVARSTKKSACVDASCRGGGAMRGARGSSRAWHASGAVGTGAARQQPMQQ